MAWIRKAKGNEVGRGAWTPFWECLHIYLCEFQSHEKPNECSSIECMHGGIPWSFNHATAPIRIERTQQGMIKTAERGERERKKERFLKYNAWESYGPTYDMHFCPSHIYLWMNLIKWFIRKTFKKCEHAPNRRDNIYSVKKQMMGPHTTVSLYQLSTTLDRQ